jgi:CRISPR-associated protein Cas5h
MNQILAFKLWGDFGHFKKYYTTTSPLTFEFPSPPTLIGIVSAIIGLDKNEYLNYFKDPDKYNISLIVNAPIKKVRWTENLIDTKQHFFNIKNRTQIRTEFLKNPSYVVYFYHDDEFVYKQLKEHLQSHTSVYTISLGLSELLANFDYLGEFSIKPVSVKNWVELDSVLPMSKLDEDPSVDFHVDSEIFKVNYPVHMRPDRFVDIREDILFERNGKTINCRLKQYWETEKGNRIVFF